MKKIKFLPKSILGKWSVVLIIAMPILFFVGISFMELFYESVSAGKTIPEDIVKRPALALFMLAGMAVGVSAFVAGLVAMVRKKERAVLVFISTLVGALLTLFLIAEVLFPH